jgi:hypothetical protein
MNPIKTETVELNGYSARIEVFHDEHMGAPWEEHDGHGIVSDWRSRDSKQPGELVLNEDHGSYRYYDYAGTLAIARKDGWGLSAELLAALERKLGRKATKREITAASVMRDYEHLRAWCNDEWQWLGYTTTITTPDGTEIDGDSCWGFDEEKYMMSEAKGNAESTIADLIASAATESTESFRAACSDIVTV